MEDQIKELYKLRTDFLIIGLTGRLGSGCSTVAELLTKENFEDCKFPIPVTDRFNDNEERKYRTTYNYLKENWQNFTLIRASDIIVFTLLKFEYNDLVISIKSKFSYDLICDKLNDKFNELKNILGENMSIDEGNCDGIYNIFFEDKKLRYLAELFKEEFKKHTTDPSGSIFQKIGDNLRKTGDPFEDSDDKFKATNSYIIADHIKKLIKIYRQIKGKKAIIVIDSIRNSFEARYFRERYSAFYLFAINTEDEYRGDRLAKDFSKTQINNLDVEYLSDLTTNQTFYKQDIKSCIQMADIYLHNPTGPESTGDTFKTLKMSLVRYLSLIFQPGIITPTAEERTMQIAYTAKYNSGCISRQVGAVVTDNSYSVKSIGWNNTPQGQTPCLLRNAEDLINNTDNESFSDYEKSHEIKNLVQEAVLKDKSFVKYGKNPCFCFKQVKNTLDGEKNQVHTRSLHAEENAMLQISKYGGEGLTNGFLFTTASPCELCSKKAYQLGIKKIFYIDPYPGIAITQILKTGNNIPELVIFNGAVGKAYHSIFEPFMAYKDELELQFHIDLKKATQVIYKKVPSLRKVRIKKLIEQKEQIEQELDYLNQA